MTDRLSNEQLALREVFHRAWGPYLHVGVFSHPAESVSVAAARGARLAAEKASPLPDDRVLEVGCGFGHMAQMLVRRFGCQVTATDLEEWRLVEARRRAENLHGISFEQADYGDLPYEDETFDWAWATGTLSYARNLTTSIFELSRVLKTEGRFAVRDFMTATTSDDTDRIAQLTHIPRLWSLDRWNSEVAESNLQVNFVDNETQHARETYARLREKFREMIPEFGSAAVTAAEIMDRRLELIDQGLFGCFFLLATKSSRSENDAGSVPRNR